MFPNTKRSLASFRRIPPYPQEPPMSPPSRRKAITLWTIVVFVVASQYVASCPLVCRCIGKKRVTVYCDYKELETVPPNIPLETTHLFLMGNKFTSVLPSMFLGNAKNSDGTFATEQSTLTNLTVIRLDLNPISIVNEHAFLRGPSLKLIYLPFDVKIQRQAFAEMKNDKETFEGFTRVADHPLEDPLFVAFSKF